jgi:hypothetical protein
MVNSCPLWYPFFIGISSLSFSWLSYRVGHADSFFHHIRDTTQAKHELAALEPISKGLNSTDILTTDTDEIIHELWYPVKRATSSRDLTPGVSVTKFLHFSFPQIFPMVDLNRDFPYQL